MDGPPGNFVSILEDKHKITMVLILFNSGKMLKSQLYDQLPTKNSNGGKKLDDLMGIGIVVFDRRNKNNATYVELTDLGRNVAKKLTEIDYLMQGIDGGEEVGFAASPKEGHALNRGDTS